VEQRRSGRRSGESGFTLLEVLVVVAIIGIMALWGYPALLNTLNRVKLTGIARETSLLLQQARMEAIKRALNTEVLYLDAVSCAGGVPCFLAFVDVDGDGAYIAANDDEIGGTLPIPNGIELRAPTQAAEGTKAIDAWDDAPRANDGPVYNTDGSVDKAGAFRLADGRGNYLEVRIEFLGTGKPTLQKWFGGGDPDINWYENGELGNTWEW
jgi:prepilin-type N-terminal cleavage/methylation domain-containing protein